MSKYLDVALGILKAASLIVIALFVFRLGAISVQSKWDKAEKERQQAENLAIFQRIRNNERLAEQQDLDNQRLKKAHADEVANLTAAYAADRGLRISAAICAGFAGTANAEGTSGSHAIASATRSLPDETERDLKALGLEYETAIASCRVAQGFIRDNGMAP